MNKLTKLMLASAVMITSGFADASGSTIDEYLDASDGLSITANTTVTKDGVIDMGSGCLTVSEGCVLTNNGTIDISDVTDFSEYQGTVNGCDGSVVVIPRQGKLLTKHTSGNFEFKGDYELEYDSDCYFCEVNNGVITSNTNTSYVYADVAAVQSALGLTFSGEPELTDVAVFTLNDLINDPVNSASNVGCTYNIEDANLNHKELELGAEATMNFGLVSKSDSTIEVKKTKLTIAGNCTGMLGKIKTDSDLKFKSVGSNGSLEVAGKLSYVNDGSNTIETTCDHDIKAGSLIVGDNMILKCSGPLTIGWVKPVYLCPSSVSWNVLYFYNYKVKDCDYGLMVTDSGGWLLTKGGWTGEWMDTITLNVYFSPDDIGVRIDKNTGKLTYGNLITEDKKMEGDSVNFVQGEITYKEVSAVFRAIKDGTASYLGSYVAQ